MTLLALAALCTLIGGCSESEGTQQGDTVRIGALLPYTGELAASGTNIERAILWAAEEVNEAGGVAGRKVEIIPRDSNSSVGRGIDATRELIEDEGVVAIIGPEYDELAKAIMPLVTENEVIAVSGGVTSPIFTTLDTAGYWFRTTPTAQAFGSVLADRAFEDGIRRLAIIYVSDEYGRGFAHAVERRFTQARAAHVRLMPFASGSKPSREMIAEIAAYRPEGVALIAYPKTGAQIVADWVSLGSKVNWYFSHTLRSDEFVQNVPPGSIENSTGTSHSLPRGDVIVFSSLFEDHWPGDTPLTAAYFNYDAFAVLVLAIEEAFVEYQTKGIPSADQIARRMRSVSSSSRGKSIPWHDLDRGLELVRYKNVPNYGGINYRGVSGFVDLDENGDIFTGLVQLWTVKDGRVVGGETVTPKLDAED